MEICADFWFANLLFKEYIKTKLHIMLSANKNSLRDPCMRHSVLSNAILVPLILS